LTGKKIRAFLDTTYIMPLFGIETDKFSRKDLAKLLNIKNMCFLVSLISLVEIKWIIISKTRKNTKLRKTLREKYNKGLDVLYYRSKIKIPSLITPEIDETENKLLDFGLSDYFDRIIFSMAYHEADILLTEDQEIHNMWKDHQDIFEGLVVISWEHFLQKFK